MAVTDSSKVDLLYKKLFGVTKTDTSANKSPSNESISSPALLRGDTVYLQSSQIPGTAAAVSGIVQAYLTTNRIQCTADTTSVPVSSIYPTWKTSLTDWIDPGNFGSTYQVRVYYGASGLSDPASSGGTQIFADGSGGTGEWFFDYQSGVLNFIGGTNPSGMSSSSVIYIYGYRYIGTKGVYPSQTSNSGKYLTTDGTNVSWGTVSGYSAPTLGSTSIASGATVTSISGLTLNNGTITGSLTAGGGTGTNGQVLQSTGTGVQWATVSGGGGGGGGTTTNPLTIGTGLSGTSFDGSTAVTIAIDSTVATLTDSQTLTNKTLTTPILSTVGGDEGGQIEFGLPATNTTLNTRIAIDSFQNRLRIFETGGTSRGAYIDLANASAGAGSEIVLSDISQTLTNKTINGSNNTISNISLTSSVTGALPVANGGTGQTSYTTGDILYASSSSALSKLSAGVNGYVLTLDSGVPTWQQSPGTNASNEPILASLLYR